MQYRHAHFIIHVFVRAIKLFLYQALMILTIFMKIFRLTYVKTESKAKKRYLRFITASTASMNAERMPAFSSA